VQAHPVLFSWTKESLRQPDWSDANGRHIGGAVVVVVDNNKSPPPRAPRNPNCRSDLPERDDGAAGRCHS
jgi:hypothetical protein